MLRGLLLELRGRIGLAIARPYLARRHAHLDARWQQLREHAPDSRLPSSRERFAWGKRCALDDLLAGRDR